MDAKAKREARKERETQRLIKKIRALQERLHRRSLQEHQRQEKARNPMGPSVWIGLGVLAAGLTTLGIYEHYKGRPPAAGVITLSIGAGQTYSWTMPGGGSNPTFSYNTSAVTESGSGTFTGNISGATGTAAGNGATITISPTSVGTAQLVIGWTDASGKSQTTTVNFNIVA